MFNLEQSIVDWRKQMLAGGVETPVPLEELESHLREAIDRQMASGIKPAPAFETASRQMGTVRSLTTEFDKNNQRKIIMKRILILTTGVVAILVGMAFVMPAVAQYRHEGAMVGGEVVLLYLGCLLTLGGVGAAIVGAIGRKA